MSLEPHRRRIRSLLRSHLVEDAEEELAHHLEMRTRELVASGMEPEAAREEALRRFGDLERVRREVVEIDRSLERRRSLVTWAMEFLQDLKLSFRTLARSPGFVLVAVATLGLGIGANLAVFSAFNQVVLRPLPFQDPDRLVMVWEENPERGWYMQTVAASNMLDWRERVEAFDDVAAYASFEDRMALTGDGADPRMVSARAITGNFFSVLGVRPEVGTLFRFEDTWSDSERAVVLGHDAWQRTFGGSAAVIGRTMRLDGRDFRVIGVLPADFRYPGASADVWVNIGWDRAAPADPSFRRAHWLWAVARLAPDVGLEQARAELEQVARQLEAEYPETNRLMGAGITPLHGFLLGDLRTTLLVVLVAVGLLLVLACTNVGNLLLVRSLGRQRELAVRSALGAGRLRLIRHGLAEGMLLSSLGAIAGVAVAWALLEILGATSGVTVLPEATSPVLDGRFVVYLVSITTASTLFFGIVPAVVGTRPTFGEALKEGGGSKGPGRSARRVASLLVVGQVALTVLLLSGATLLARSYVQLRRVDAGFDPSGVLTASVVLPEARYLADEEVVSALDELRRRAGALPGVVEAAAVRQLPLTRPSWSSDFTVEGRAQDEYGVEVVHREVTPGYFETVRVPLIRGRTFTDSDRAESTPVIVVNEALVEEYFPGSDPIGARIAFSRDPGPDDRWWTVVGVVGSVRQGRPADPARPEIFAPVSQDVARGMTLVLRSAVDPASLAGPLRDAVRRFDAELVLDDVRTLDDVHGAAMVREEFLSLVFGAFAVVAVVLALVGVYGVVAQSARARQREIGIRLALGAARPSVVGLIARHSFGVLAAGVALGTVTALFAASGLSAFLYGIAPRDPLTLGSSALLLLLVGLGAAIVPAVRAGRTDPMRVLRDE